MLHFRGAQSAVDYRSWILGKFMTAGRLTRRILATRLTFVRLPLWWLGGFDTGGTAVNSTRLLASLAAPSWTYTRAILSQENNLGEQDHEQEKEAGKAVSSPQRTQGGAYSAQARLVPTPHRPGTKPVPAGRALLLPFIRAVGIGVHAGYAPLARDPRLGNHLPGLRGVSGKTPRGRKRREDHSGPRCDFSRRYLGEGAGKVPGATGTVPGSLGQAMDALP